MLTAFQCATGAYMTEDGELLCPECFDRGDTLARPVSNYGLDEWQTSEAEGYDWSYEADPDAGPLDEDRDLDAYHEECSPALYDVNGHELLEAYHYHRERERDVDEGRTGAPDDSRFGPPDAEQERRWAALDASVPCAHSIPGTCDRC